MKNAINQLCSKFNVHKFTVSGDAFRLGNATEYLDHKNHKMVLQYFENLPVVDVSLSGEAFDYIVSTENRILTVTYVMSLFITTHYFEFVINYLSNLYVICEKLHYQHAGKKIKSLIISVTN